MPRRSLPPTSAFAADDGACPPLLAAALAEPDAEARLRAVVGALATQRVLVPVVAHLDERDEESGGEKVASAAMVTVRTPDGRAALPAFSSVATLAEWDPAARPVPAPGVRVALAAASDADGLVVLDPAGPQPVLLPRPAVWALARRRPWVPSPADPLVAAAVTDALERVPGVSGSWSEPGRRAELCVVLGVPAGLDRASLDAVVAAAGDALAASEVVAERVDSLELRVVAVRPPGR